MSRILGRSLGLFIYGWLWVLGLICYKTPFALRDFKARVLAWTWFHVLRFRRQVILHNLAAVFPRESQESMSEFRERCYRLAQENMRHYVHCLYEILERFHWKPEMIGNRVVVDGLDNLQRAQQQGFFFLTAHLGNWELITIVGIFLKTRLAIITKFLRNSFFDELWVRSRKRFGLELLEEKGSGLAAVRAVRQGKAVGFILDQHTGEPHGLLARFMGVPAWCPKGLAILATRLEVPVVPAYLLRQKDGSFVLHVEGPLAFPELSRPEFRTESGHLNDRGLHYHIDVCNENMERWIRRAPAQYLWLHKRFKSTIDYRAPLVWQM